MGGMAGGATVSIIIRAIDQFSGVFAKVNKGLALAGAAAVAAGAAIASGMVTAGKAAAEVETSFAKVNTLLDKGQDAQELYGDYVAKTNVILGNQGDQLSVLEGLYQVQSAGITDVAESQTFMTAATKAAVGGSAELSTVILAGTKALTAFGMSVDDTEKVMDMFAGTVKAGQTTMSELANAFPNVAGMAAQAGVSIQETLGTFAGLTKVLASSDETATALSATIRGFIKPSESMQKAVNELGYESATAMIKTLGLNNALRKLNEHIDGDTEAMAKLFPNVRALKAVFPMLGLAAEDVAKSIDTVSNSAGLSQKQFDDMTNTIQYQWGRAMSAAKNILIDIGRVINDVFAPVIRFMANILEKVSNLWMMIPDPIKKVIVVVMTLTSVLLVLGGAFALIAAFWPVLVGFFAALIPLMITGIGLIWSAVTATTAFVAANIWWIGIIMAVIAIIWLLIKAGKYLISHWDELKQKGTILGAHIKNMFIGIHNIVVKIWNAIVNFIEKSINRIIRMVNHVIKAMNRIPGIHVPTISYINLGKFKGEMLPYVTVPTFTPTPIPPKMPEMPKMPEIPEMPEIPGISAGPTTNITVNIDQVSGMDPTDVSEALQKELSSKISLA